MAARMATRIIVVRIVIRISAVRIVIRVTVVRIVIRKKISVEISSGSSNYYKCD